MLSLLRRRFRAEPEPQPRFVPDGERVYAIGDIHGRLDMFDALLSSIDRDSARRGPARVRIVILGDLIDRGPASAEVVERVRMLVGDRKDTTCLMGNHEEILLLALEGDKEALRLFSRIGGRETMESYGIGANDFNTSSDAELAVLMRDRIPASHVEFLERLPLWTEIGDYLFVHAGIRPGIPIDEQKPADLRWIRAPFLHSIVEHGKMVVHGHTVTGEVDAQANRIGIDTGAAVGGRLTAIGLESDAMWFLDVGQPGEPGRSST